MVMIIPIPSLKDNYIWAIVNEKNRCAAIVDPGDAIPALDFLNKNQLILVVILITHHHWDHTNGISALLNYANVPVISGANSQLTAVNYRVQDNEKIFIDKIEQSFTVVAIPGHTLDHIAFYSSGILFCGDTLFAAGCGRAFEGTPTQLFQSLQKLMTLPDDTRIYCAHEYTENNFRFAGVVEPENIEIKRRREEIKKIRAENLPSLPSKLAIERMTNPFLRCDVAAVKIAAENYAGRQLHNSAAIFTVLREWKNHFK